MKKLLILLTFILSLYSCNGQINAERTLFKYPKDQFILDSVSLKSKTKNFKVVTLEMNDKKNKHNAQHNSNPIIILVKDNGKYYKVFQNNKIIFSYDDNCPADGYGSIVAKNNYFTIEQIFCSDFLFVKSYTTFKINDNETITLHKYGEEFTDRSDPDKKILSKIWTKKDFGEINFEVITENFLLKLRLTKPKK